MSVSLSAWPASAITSPVSGSTDVDGQHAADCALAALDRVELVAQVDASCSSRTP